MNLEETFSLLNQSFSNVFHYTPNIMVNSELDWERHIYLELRNNLGDQVFKRYEIRLETRAFKFGNNILWISPNKYYKKKELIDQYFNVQQDEGGHFKISLSNHLKPLTTTIKQLIKAEGNRFYYVDIILFDKQIKRSLAYLELKYGNNLSQNAVLEDFYKLKRLELVRDFKAIFIAIGYDPLNDKILWMPTDKEYNYREQPKTSNNIQITKNISASEPSENIIVSTIKSSTKILYENVDASEANWAAELMFSIKSILPSSWRVSSEIPIKGVTNGRIDLGIYNNLNDLITAIEIKNHYEAPYPVEMLNGLCSEETKQKDFFTKTKDFINQYDADKMIMRQRSAFPKNADGYYLNSDFFEKIIEIYYQCKRISEMIIEEQIKEGYMIYIDHNDDYTLRKKTNSISEEDYINNFYFRKFIIEKILGQSNASKCKFIYLFKLNSKNGTRKLYFTDDFPSP